MAKKSKNNQAPRETKVAPEESIVLDSNPQDTGVVAGDDGVEANEDTGVEAGDDLGIDSLMEEKSKPLNMATTMPEEIVDPSIRMVGEYLKTVSMAIPEDSELARLNSRLRSAIYTVLDTEDTELAMAQLRTIVLMAKSAPAYVFDTSMTFRHLNEMRWARGMRREYESILATISKMRRWETEGDTGNHSWEQVRADIRPLKSERYMRLLLGSIGLNS